MITLEMLEALIMLVVFTAFCIYCIIKQNQQKRLIEVVGTGRFKNNSLIVLLVICVIGFLWMNRFNIWIIIGMLPAILAVYLYMHFQVGIGKEGIVYHNSLFRYDDLLKYQLEERNGRLALAIKGVAGNVSGRGKKDIGILFENLSFAMSDAKRVKELLQEHAAEKESEEAVIWHLTGTVEDEIRKDQEIEDYKKRTEELVEEERRLREEGENEQEEA